MMTATGHPQTEIAHHTAPEPGQLVEARRRQWIVSAVDGGSTAPSSPKRHLVRLASIDEDSLGEKLEVVWENEPGAHVIESAGLPRMTGLDEPDMLQAFLDAVRWGAATNADRGYQSIMLKGASHANAWLTFVQLVAGLALLFLGISTAFAILGDAPPVWADYGAKALGLYGIITAIQALRGKSVLGMFHLSGWFSRQAFLNYSTRHGVPPEVARSRFTADNGRVNLTNQKDIEAE